MASYTQKSVLAQNLANGASPVRPTMGGLPVSYSTNDIPTLKNANGGAGAVSPPKTNAQQQFHNHNASLGRIPPHAINAANNRLSRDIANGETRPQSQEPMNSHKQLHSELQASAAPFGPSMLTSLPVDSMGGMMSPPQLAQYAANSNYYGGYGMQLMNMGMTPMHMGGPNVYHNPMALYQTASPFNPYSPYGQPGRLPDSQTRVIQQRRIQTIEGESLRLDCMPHDGLTSISRHRTIHQRQDPELSGRDLRPLQGPTRLSVSPEAARRTRARNRSFDLLGDQPTRCRTDDR